MQTDHPARTSLAIPFPLDCPAARHALAPTRVGPLVHLEPIARPASEPGPHLLDASMFWGASGGVHRVLTTKHRVLSARGWRHTVLAPGAGGPGQIDCRGLPLPASGGYRLVIDRRNAARQIEAARPDIVEAADPYVLAWSVLDATRRLGVPAVAFCHSNLPALTARLIAGPQGLRQAHGRWAARRAQSYLARLYSRFDLVLAPSRSMTQLLRHWGVTQALHQPLGVDCSIFTPDAVDPAWRSGLLRQLDLAAQTRLLVFCGRFAPEKNLNLLGRAVDLLGPGHALLAVGSGPCPPVGDRVRLLQPEVDSHRLARLLASADAFVHAGDQETFGLAALEAMACGTPVVVDAAGGLGELAQGAGFTVTTGHARGWAEAIEAALDQGPSDQVRVALQRARGHDWNLVLTQLARRYRLLMQGHRGEARADAALPSRHGQVAGLGDRA